MENSTIGWILLLLAFFISTFGLFWCFCMILSFIFFVFGFLSTLYVARGSDNFSDVCPEDPLTGETPITEGGLKKVIELLEARQKPPKTDRRITGSELIDSPLQEILGYIIRDYILPWYSLLSTDDEFPEVTVRSTAQNFAINISNRVKQIDWIPYLTTRLVDDAASHLRLYKQARNKLEQSIKLKSQGSSPARDQNLTPNYSIHRRNKSEADMTKYGKNKDAGRGNVGNSKFYLPDQSKNTLEDYFFELECQMENNVICRDAVCVDPNEEKEFLSDLVELLLYMLLPDEDFACKPLRFILREILSNCVLVPLFTNISDPDFINQTMVWLCIRENLPSDIFLLTLRLTDNCDELIYTKELVTKEMQLLRSRDSGGDGDLFIKQQLSSLSYLTKLIDSRLSKLENTKGSESTTIDYAKLETVKKIILPLDVILKNNVALSYFIDFATIGGFQAYVFFYLNIEGWKVSTEQQLSALHINKMKNLSDNASGVDETIRSAALSLFEQYLGEKSQHKVQVKPSLVQTLYFKIRNINESPTEQWFNSIQEHIYDKLQTQHEFLPAFRESKAYLKLLEELDLLQQTVDEDTISLNSNESGEVNPEQAKTSSQRNVNFLTVENSKLPKHVRSLSDITDMGAKDDKRSSSQGRNSSQERPKESFSASKEEKKENLKVGDFNLTVVIIETGIVCEKGKTFGVYALQVTRQFDTGFLEEWHVYRRYSDFYDLHTKIKDKFPDLSKLPFPGKKTFHNMDRSVLEKRMKMLGSYLQQICQRHVLSSHPALSKLLMKFLEQGEYDRATSGGPISHTIDTIVNPLKSGMKTIKNMPEQLINTVDEVVEGISKVFTSKGPKLPEASKVGAALDHESDDNIPLRIMLLLMDEVFDLKSRNQWLRRRMVTLLRQILRAMFGDIVNRRILDYVSYITSPQNVAHYLHTFKNSFWPNGVKAEKGVERDKATRFRTRVAAKVALLMWSTDDLKHIIGSETMRRGLLTIFELFQRPILNRRLLYVLLEGVLTHFFPDKDMPKIFQKLHSKKKCDYSKTR